MTEDGKMVFKGCGQTENSSLGRQTDGHMDKRVTEFSVMEMTGVSVAAAERRTPARTVPAHTCFTHRELLNSRRL